MTIERARGESIMRIIMSLLAGVLALAAAGPAAAQQKTQIKFLLDWKYQAVHSWYFVAQQKGYFAREGLDVVLDQGAGGAGTTQAIVSNQYPMGVGDINILIQATATRTNTPLVVYMLYNNPPFALIATWNPKSGASFRRILTAGMVAVTNDVEGVSKALVTAAPLTNAPLERKRRDSVCDNLMLAPETEKLGLGDVDDQRMAKGIAMLAEAFELPRKPAPGEVFDRSFLPARAERTY